MLSKIRRQAVLFWVAVVGFIWYVVQPILLPDVPSHPELLPVYTTMFGLSRAMKADKKRDDDEDGPSDE